MVNDDKCQGWVIDFYGPTGCCECCDVMAGTCADPACHCHQDAQLQSSYFWVAVYQG